MSEVSIKVLFKLTFVNIPPKVGNVGVLDSLSKPTTIH